MNVDYGSTLNTQEAFNRLEQEQPDLLISELMLENYFDPTVGEDFIIKAAKKYPGLKIMVLTTVSDLKIRKRLKKYVIHYETKAFQPSKLRKQILKILKVPH